MEAEKLRCARDQTCRRVFAYQVNQKRNEEPSGEGEHQERKAKSSGNTVGKARSGRPTEIVRTLLDAALVVRPRTFGIGWYQLAFDARYGSL